MRKFIFINNISESSFLNKQELNYKLKVIIALALLLFLIGNDVDAQHPAKYNYSSDFSELQDDGEAGQLCGWGDNTYGQIGDGSTKFKEIPGKIGNTHNWKMVATGVGHTIALKSDGTLWAWGKNNFGQLGGPIYSEAHTPVQIGENNDWKYIACSSTSSFAIKKDGDLWAWGWNTTGILGDSTIEKRFEPVKINLHNVIKVASIGDDVTLAITENGTLWAWGTGALTKYPSRIGSDSDWVNLCGGFVIKKDGTFWIYENKVINKFDTNENWLSLSLLDFYYKRKSYLALKKDSTIWAWGDNSYGQLGDGTTIDRNEPTKIGTDNDWVFADLSLDQQRCNGGRTIGIKKDGSLWCWGVFKIWGTFSEVHEDDSLKRFLIPTKIENIREVIPHSFSNNYSPYHTLFIRRYKPKLPDVSTLLVKNITSFSAEGGGKVLSDGDDDYVYRGVCYSKSKNPTIKNNIVECGSDVGEYQSIMEGLKPYTKYYVRAYATNTVGTAYGQEETFTTKLEVPLLISPKNNTNNLQSSISLVWEKIDSAQNYRLQLSKSSTFDVLLADETTDKLTYDYSKYELNSVYYWRVQAIHGIDSSDWSEVWAFSTSKFIPQNLQKPANDSINVPIDCELSWKENIAGSKYNLQLSKNNDFTSPKIDTTIFETNFILSKLDYLHLYYWRVRAKEGTDISDWSPVWKFTTLMDSVNLKTPMDLSKYINIPSAFVWEAGIYKKDYRLQVSDTDDFATASTDTLISKTANADVKNLNYWQKYFWRVRNESGDTLGYWSEIWQFKIRMSDMLLMYPENTQTGLEQEINFKWNAVIGAEYYQLQISKNDNFTNMVYSKDSITATEKLVPDLEKDILYYWRVRVWNTESIGTAYWSEVWTFRTGETGVKDELDAIQIIPNPAGDFITITLGAINPIVQHGVGNDNSEIFIYNTLGEKVMTVEQTFLSVQQINISSLPKGIYFVKIGGEAAKFVKM